MPSRKNRRRLGRYSPFDGIAGNGRGVYAARGAGGWDAENGPAAAAAANTAGCGEWRRGTWEIDQGYAGSVAGVLPGGGYKDERDPVGEAFEAVIYFT